MVTGSRGCLLASTWQSLRQNVDGRRAATNHTGHGLLMRLLFPRHTFVALEPGKEHPCSSSHGASGGFSSGNHRKGEGRKRDCTEALK